MYSNHNILTEYEYDGVFYKVESSTPEDGDILGPDDGDLLGDETTEEGKDESADEETDETILLEVKCDIQKTDNLITSGVITMGYDIYFPTPKGDIPDTIKPYVMPNGLVPGVRFRSTMYGLKIDGMVIGLFPSQMGGCLARIKGTDI